MLSRAAGISSRTLEASASPVVLVQRYLSSSGGKSGFKPRRRPGQGYRGPSAQKFKHAKKGTKQPFEVSKRVPKIDMSNIKINDLTKEGNDAADLDLDLGMLDPQLNIALKIANREDLDIETQLKMMDYFTSAPGSTEDLVGERRIMALEALEKEDRDALLAQMEELIERQRLDYLDLPEQPIYDLEELQRKEAGGSTQIPANQLAHGEWGEQLIRTDRVCKMWRGGRIESFRALVIGGNLRGCGGFGVGKSFEAQDAVEIACRMAKRNIFFVDRYRGRGITRDLVGRQNSCKVQLRATDNGLRGNPLSVEILKLMGITNVVAKAHGSRSHYNVVRATFKALQTHESLDDIAMKRGLRLINLQKAKHLQV